MSAREWLAGHRPGTRYARLRAELDAVDRGLVETGLIAARAIERLDAQDEAWAAWRQATGYSAHFAAHDGAFRHVLRVVPDGESCVRPVPRQGIAPDPDLPVGLRPVRRPRPGTQAVAPDLVTAPARQERGELGHADVQ